MRLLLDTNALLWWATDESLLSKPARSAIGDAANWVAVSAASIWEIAIKRAAGKLFGPDSLSENVSDYGLNALPITHQHAWAAGRLPLHHRDPFDRLLVAQAQLGGLTLVTRDARFARYQVAILPA